MENKLIPSYLEMDFNSMKTRLRYLLLNDPTFKDYNIYGSNISIIMELMCYIGSLTTYYLNRIAKNCFIDTADSYETTHMLASLRGYQPRGYRSSYTNLTVTVNSENIAGHVLKIPAWKEITCPKLKDSDGNLIKFATVQDTFYTVPLSGSFPYTIDVPVRQGEVIEYTYSGSDLIDNILHLPSLKFDYGSEFDKNPSIELYVGGVLWNRVYDVYDRISGLQQVDNVYMLKYNKYQKYIIEFPNNRRLPLINDEIKILMLRSCGSEGNVPANTIIKPENQFVYDITTEQYIDKKLITVTNKISSTGGSEPDSINEIKESSIGILHSQYRDVTKSDYIYDLKTRPDIIAANVWGEQEIAPSGSVLDYNKVYISLIPNEWSDSTISYVISGGMLFPVEYSNTWKIDISTYLEPKRMISAYEEYVLPEIVYFSFDIGVKVKRTYTISAVLLDVKNKLIEFFNPMNRAFGETISFTDVMEYILDTSDYHTYKNIRGIQALIIRDVRVSNYMVYEPNEDGHYPQYVDDYYSGENKLRRIKVGFNQFPMLYVDGCRFMEEM